MKTSDRGRVPRFALEQLAICIAYLALAKLGLAFASIHPSVAPIWPATGFAVAALLLWGMRGWPAIFLAALIANVTTAGTITSAIAIAGGNTLEALVIAALVTRWCGGIKTFETPSRVLAFALICGATGTVISATIGVTTLCATELAPWGAYRALWATWWFGNLAGAIVVTPLIILWAKPPSQARDWRGAAALYGATIVIGLVAFSPLLGHTPYLLPLSFVSVLPLLWAGVRHGRRETMTVAVLLSGFALWGVIAGAGPFIGATMNESMLRLSAFMIATTVPSLALAAEVLGRRRVEAELRGQEQDLRAMFDQALVGIGETNPRGRILSVNDKFCEIIGRSRAELLGLHMQELTDPEDLMRDDPQFRDIAAKGGGFTVDKRYMRPDGSRVWVRNNVSTVTDAQGKTIRFVIVSEDVTERHHSREELKRQVEERTAALAATERNLRLLIESVSDYAIIMLDIDGKIASWNAGSARIKGYSASEVIGKNFSLFYMEEDRARGLPERALSTAREKGLVEAEGWRVRKDGSRFWADVVIRSVTGEDGQLIGFAKVTRDITERRQATEALEEAREQLFQAQKLEAVGQLTGGVAHDFNNILAVILSGVTLIDRHIEDAPRVRHVLDLMRKTAHRGEGVIKQLLAFSRRAPTRVQAVDVGTRLKETFDLLDRLLGETVTVKFDIAQDLSFIEVDPGQFDLAILNICLNARDAMPHGGTIGVVAYNENAAAGERVVISISDTGEGMSDEVRGRAFEPFFTTKEVGKGSGLGLSQAYGFAQSSRGEIEIESASGRGTTVTFRLPSTTSRPQAAKAVSDGVRRIPAELTVLVIEDDPSLASVTEALVSDAGYAVKLVHSAHEALETLQSEGGRDIGAIFSDVVMPGRMNGFELARTVKREFPHIPILLTSGYSGAVAAQGEEGVRVLAKPYEPDELFAALEEMMAEAPPATTV